MKSAIERLYFGTFAQIEKLKLSDRQREALDVIIACDEQLTAILKGNKEAVDLFEGFKRALGENAAAEALGCYKEGFRNGFQIALDAMRED